MVYRIFGLALCATTAAGLFGACASFSGSDPAILSEAGSDRRDADRATVDGATSGAADASPDADPNGVFTVCFGTDASAQIALSLASAGTVVTTENPESTIVTFNASSTTDTVLVRGFSELTVPRGLQSYKTLTVRAHLKTEAANRSSWDSSAYLSVLGVLAGKPSEINTAGKASLILAKDVLDFKLYPTGSNTSQKSQTLEASFPDSFTGDVTITVALQGTPTTAMLGGSPVVITDGFVTAAGTTVTLFVGGYAGEGAFEKTRVTVDHFCADLAP